MCYVYTSDYVDDVMFAHIGAVHNRLIITRAVRHIALTLFSVVGGFTFRDV